MCMDNPTGTGAPDGRLEPLDDIEKEECGKYLYSDPYVQEAIKLFIEFGADLDPQDVEMLAARLPKPNGKNIDWPQFLYTYSQPKKRVLLRRDRRKRIQHWPESAWSEEDRILMGLAAPDLDDDWWSTGRRLLELDFESSEDEL